MNTENYDQSHLDTKYFIDVYKYNCPFCNRRHVSYRVAGRTKFNWNREKNCWVYYICCDSCDNISMHLSWVEIPIYSMSGSGYRFDLSDDAESDKSDKVPIDIDKLFFHHQPTSFFTVDKRISREIRELITEAEACRKMNHLTGGSACLRKAIYELLRKEGIGPDVGDYGSRIKALKKKFPSLDSTYFDILANIKDMADDKLHEESWEAFDSSTLSELLYATKAVLYEMYVLPDEKKVRLGPIPKLLAKLKKDKQQVKVDEQSPSV